MGKVAHWQVAALVGTLNEWGRGMINPLKKVSIDKPHIFKLSMTTSYFTIICYLSFELLNYIYGSIFHSPIAHIAAPGKHKLACPSCTISGIYWMTSHPEITTKWPIPTPLKAENNQENQSMVKGEKWDFVWRRMAREVEFQSRGSLELMDILTTAH